MSLVRKKNDNLDVDSGIVRIVCLVVSVVFVCYLLYSDGDFPYTISKVWAAINNLTLFSHYRLATVGLLPIYVSLMVFGAAFVGKSFASVIYSLFNYLKKK